MTDEIQSVEADTAKLRAREKRAAWRVANPERARERDARYREKYRTKVSAWRDTNRVRLRENFRRYYAANRKLFRERGIERRYGMTAEGFATMLISQLGLCALCKKVLSHDHSKIAIDHDHATGKVRGLLHLACNVAVGSYENFRSQLEAYLHG